MEASAAAFAYFEQRREVARLEAADELASWEAHWRYLHARERSMLEGVGR